MLRSIYNRRNAAHGGGRSGAGEGGEEGGAGEVEGEAGGADAGGEVARVACVICQGGDGFARAGQAVAEGLRQALAMLADGLGQGLPRRVQLIGRQRAFVFSVQGCERVRILSFGDVS